MDRVLYAHHRPGPVPVEEKKAQSIKKFKMQEDWLSPGFEQTTVPTVHTVQF
ncbi:Protein CBG04860 [Caenorhabditis briggsae]|uniref:Protein CBG04860 n=1 Tax=Caenorhabditis briggsae TaxID=6238 RepID=A8WYN1_CAEBR|nr:Protein CBG04860 [Caenorhabditis briggsae]CAP25489.1 Protein CBG04860 [Caenorhabditis briggsae]